MAEVTEENPRVETPMVILEEKPNMINTIPAEVKTEEVTTLSQTSTKEPTTAPTTTKKPKTKPVITTKAKPTTTTPKITTVTKSTPRPKQPIVVQPSEGGGPGYKIVTLPSESSTTGAVLPDAGANKGVVVGVAVGVVLGIALVVAVILLVFFLKRRKKKNHEADITQIENPRYQPKTERSKGIYRFTTRDSGANSSPKGKNNNRDSDIEILATRSSSRKKRKAPAPPNPFGDDADDDFINRRQSQDPDLAPEPVELSTFHPKAAPISEADEKSKVPEAKPLLNKDKTEANNSTAASDKEGDDSGLEDAETSKLIEELERQKAEQDKVELPKTPDDYDKTKNPFAES